MSRSSFNPFISLRGLSEALFKDQSNPVPQSKCEKSFSLGLCCFQPSFFSLLSLSWISTFLLHLYSVFCIFFLFQTLRPQRMRPQSLRWKPKKGPGDTRTRLDAEDLQVLHLKPHWGSSSGLALSKLALPSWHLGSNIYFKVALLAKDTQ